MVLWRISNHTTLDGRGGLIASARWHNQGRPIVYLAATPAGALIEALVHLELLEGAFPDFYQLLKVQVPDAVSRGKETVRDSRNALLTRPIGDAWLEKGASALLEVPSAIVPETSNWLLNPAHADARLITIEWKRRYPFDQRLL